MDAIKEEWEKEKLKRQEETLVADIKMMDEVTDKFIKELMKIERKLEKYEKK